jgi:tRNA(fMet)-specific endonuclease VapC
MAQAARGVLIDTSILIAHLRGRLSIHELVRGYESIYISAVALYELEFGARRAGRASDFARLQLAFGPMILALGYDEAEQAAHMNGSLVRQNGKSALVMLSSRGQIYSGDWKF